MFNEVLSSNHLDLLVPTEGAYVWHLEVILVVVRIGPVSREYKTTPVVNSASDKNIYNSIKPKNTLFRVD
jgi:hypothetical protein